MSAQEHGLLPISQHAMLSRTRSLSRLRSLALELGEQERRERSGPHKAMICRNHGLLACGESIPQAFRPDVLPRARLPVADRRLAGGAKLNMPPAEVAEKVAASSARSLQGEKHRVEGAPADAGQAGSILQNVARAVRAADRTGIRHDHRRPFITHVPPSRHARADGRTVLAEKALQATIAPGTKPHVVVMVPVFRAVDRRLRSSYRDYSFMAALARTGFDVFAMSHGVGPSPRPLMTIVQR